MVSARPADGLTRDDVKYAVLESVGWFNYRRLLEPIGMISPASKGNTPTTVSINQLSYPGQLASQPSRLR